MNEKEEKDAKEETMADMMVKGEQKSKRESVGGQEESNKER